MRVLGVLRKKTGWVYRECKLVLTAERRLVHYSMDNEFKGEIRLAGAELRLDGLDKFMVATPKWTFKFKVGVSVTRKYRQRTLRWSASG